MKKVKIVLAFLFLVIAFVLVSSTAYAKYVLDYNTIAASLKIDRTKPIGIVSYSTEEMTRGNVEVTINLSEPICDVEGWILSDNKLTLSKTYEQNATEEIQIADLSGNENKVKVSIQNIDRDAPIISLVNLKNTNAEYENYANNTHTIVATIKITDLKINSSIDISKIDVLVGENKNLSARSLQNLKQTDTEITFDLVLTAIKDNGALYLNIPEAFVTDLAGNNMQETVLDTGIMIDNIKPQGNYSQEVLQSGKVMAKITADEEIINPSNWNTSDNKVFTKDFPANVSYIIEIKDFAQNKTELKISITNATYIIFGYAAHNSTVGWTYCLENNDIAGKQAVKMNPLHKVEALAFRITGQIPTDFVKISGYVHSYWNNSCNYGKCNNTGYKYKLGDVEEMSMASDNLSIIAGEKYMQIGGAGINGTGVTDYNGNNPIPRNTIYNDSVKMFPFGVSKIQISLADYSEFSVVYQILANGKGWLKSVSNGEASTAGKTLPMAAVRAAIIPKSELNSLTKLWNKDIGTYNVE